MDVLSFKQFERPTLVLYYYLYPVNRAVSRFILEKNGETVYRFKIAYVSASRVTLLLAGTF